MRDTGPVGRGGQDDVDTGDVDAGTAGPLVLFDVSRLVARIARSAPTGIDRVELAYARWLLSEPAIGLHFVAVAGAEIRRLPDSLARALVDWVGRRWEGRADRRETEAGLGRVAAFLGVAAPPSRPPDRALAGPGAFDAAPAWTRFAIDPVGRLLQNPVRLFALQRIEPVIAAAATAGRRVTFVHVSHHNLHRPEPFRRLKAAGQVRAVVFVHDLIPLDHPEFARPGDDAKHARRIATVAEIADVVVVNSDDTARRLLPHLETGGRHPAAGEPPVVVAHLGIPEPASAPQAGLPAGAPPYFVVVSTIEARKNHLLLLNLWRGLAARHGAATPKLVIVGRRGWEIESVIDLLERLPAARDHVLEAGALSDEALAAVMAGARAVLMPSLVEGFGMPVAEALSVGVPVIASRIPAHEEIAQGVAELLDPLDGPAWLAAIEDYAAEPSPRRAAQLARLAGYRPPTWAAHFDAVRPYVVDRSASALQSSSGSNSRASSGS
jgi:glycosyltransferase involved in cell wall biosynthesis